MACLKKMQILGIRSFGPDEGDKALVTFNTPLTLILGQNGSGKTTIIEALKYATCGEVPGNTDKGSAFVHDPKIGSRVEVNGQVKLVCDTVKGEQICVSRSVKVTQAKKKLSFKSVDSTITRFKKDTNEKESISGRCLDVDQEMCLALGVSKPILHYVIFCHQEDSCWPLEENKKLKEKFDAIFDATKYNKCLEQIRKERKEAKAELRVMENKLEFLEQFKVEACKKRQQLDETVGKLVQGDEEVAELDNRMKPLREQYEELKGKAANCTKLHTSRETFKGKLEELRKSKLQLQESIEKIFEGSDEELKEEIRSFEQNFSEKKEQLQNLEDEKGSLTRESNEFQKKIENKKMVIGQLNHAEDIYQRKIVTRNKDITILSNKLSVAVPNTSQITAAGTVEVLKELERSISEGQDAMELLRVSQVETENVIQTKIDASRVKKARYQQEILLKEQQLRDTDNEYKNVTDAIHDADQSVNTLEILNRRLSRVENDLTELSQSINLQDLEKLIKDQKENKYRLEDEVKALEKELEALRELREDQNKFDALQNDKVEQERKISRLKSRHGESLQHLLGEIPEQRIRHQFENRLELLSRDIFSKKSTLNEKNNKLINLKANRKNKNDKLNEMRTDLTAKNNQISELCENTDFDAVLEQVNSEIQKKQDIKGTWNGTQFMYERYINKLRQAEPCCPLCHRDFDQQLEAEELARELENNVKKIPLQSQVVLKELDDLLVKQSNLLQLKPVSEKVISLRDIEIPALTSELEDIDNEIKRLQQEYDAIKIDLEQPEQDEKLAKDIQSDIIALDHMMVELRDLERKINDQKAKIGTRSKGASYEQVLEQSKQKKDALDKVSKSLDSNQTKLQTESRKKNELQEERNRLVHEQLDLRSKSQRRAELGDKQKELQELKVKLRKELDEMSDQLQPLSLELDSQVKELEKAKKQHKNAIDDENRLWRANESQYQEIMKLQKDISEYEEKGGATRLNSAKVELTGLQQKKEDLLAQQNALLERIKEIEKFVSNLSVSRQNLISNQALRAKNLEEKEYVEEISKLSVTLGSLNFEKLQEEIHANIEDQEKIKREKGRALGRAEELRRTIKVFENELKIDQYKNAEVNHKNQLIELKVKELADEDLGNYCIALDWAMIHFHKERMKAINQIIRDLWRQIYSGNDIDTVEIKTEESETNQNDKRRTYNYRVVCKRGVTELDMRGRCSAGQKILACLIIRMALAQTFSKNCGILTLDEPTTNLDQDNIESLATALAGIVQARSVQKNFQLVVITHDEEFLNRLCHHEQVASYLKVQRNQYGKSQVITVNVN